MIRLLILLLVPLLFACHQTGSNSSGNSNQVKPDSTFIPKFAKRFKIDYYRGYKLLTITLPFDTINQNQRICIQTDSTFDINTIECKNRIFLNNHSWIALSSTQISPATLIGVKDLLLGVAEPQYISDSLIQARITAGTMRNVGMAMIPDKEVIFALNPGLVMVSPFADISYQTINQVGIAVVAHASYLESTPLGRAEWIIAMASLFNREQAAAVNFDSVVSRYQNLKKLVANITYKPTLFTGHLYQGIWNASQGKNYMACFFKDAGANYMYANTQGTGTLNLDFETVFHKNSNSDFWVMLLNIPTDITYASIAELDEHYQLFKAFKNKKIVATNAANSLFFEEGEQMPDVILADFIHAFHPDVLPHYQPRFFHHIKE